MGGHHALAMRLPRLHPWSFACIALAALTAGVYVGVHPASPDLAAQAFRADLVVEDKVIVEIKSVECLAPVHKKQLLTYLRLADKRLGLLINFQVPLIKDGITRIVNGLQDDDHAKPPSRQEA
jgi:hypothetical protein